MPAIEPVNPPELLFLLFFAAEADADWLQQPRGMVGVPCLQRQLPGHHWQSSAEGNSPPKVHGVEAQLEK